MSRDSERHFGICKSFLLLFPFVPCGGGHARRSLQLYHMITESIVVRCRLLAFGRRAYGNISSEGPRWFLEFFYCMVLGCLSRIPGLVCTYLQVRVDLCLIRVDMLCWLLCCLSWHFLFSFFLALDLALVVVFPVCCRVTVNDAKFATVVLRGDKSPVAHSASSAGSSSVKDVSFPSLTALSKEGVRSSETAIFDFGSCGRPASSSFWSSIRSVSMPVPGEEKKSGAEEGQEVRTTVRR